MTVSYPCQGAGRAWGRAGRAARARRGRALLSALFCAPDLGVDLDQLKEIMKVTGTPPAEFVQRLQSADVSWELDGGCGGWAWVWGSDPSFCFPKRRRTT